MPQIGRRYLFFLKFNDAAEDYSLETGYLFDRGNVFELDDPTYIPDTSIDLAHPLHELKESETQFVEHVRTIYRKNEVR